MLPGLIDGCPRCHAAMESSETFCSKCGADRESELKIAALEMTALSSARKWILGIGVWYVISAFLTIAMTQGPIDTHARDQLLGISFGLLVAHGLLFLWAKKQPLPAAIVAMVLFISLQLMNAVLDPTTIYKGILIKILFVVVLAKAIQAGYEVQRLRGSRR
ncbi:MAG TPA: zinc ribbon domain-containing protein [Kofleriaceae bacterium]|nr:zinc ribbon domain-containing protein [Kofleriaceae bacterium]